MCDCIERVNEKLKAFGNTVIDTPIVFSPNGLDTRGCLIETCKIDKADRRRPSRLFASFCPFCGEAYNK